MPGKEPKTAQNSAKKYPTRFFLLVWFSILLSLINDPFADFLLHRLGCWSIAIALRVGSVADQGV